MANECVPYFRPAANITGHATANVTGKRFVAVSNNLQTDGSISVAHAAAGAKAFGVVAYDAASGEKVGVLRAGHIAPVTAGGTIAAGAEVEVGSNGQAITLASGKAVGYAVTGATNGNDARIALY